MAIIMWPWWAGVCSLNFTCESPFKVVLLVGEWKVGTSWTMSNHHLCQVNQRNWLQGWFCFLGQHGLEPAAQSSCKAMDHALGAGAQLSSSGGKFISSLGLSFQLQLNPGFPEGQVGHLLEGLGALPGPSSKQPLPLGLSSPPWSLLAFLQRSGRKG